MSVLKERHVILLGSITVDPLPRPLAKQRRHSTRPTLAAC
jgi:hypothetical protein